MTTPDPDIRQQLEDAIEAHRGDAQAYRRLGGLLKDRRYQLSTRHAANRNRFARETLMPLGLTEKAAEKLAYDFEAGGGGTRKGFPAATLLMAARAYAVEPASIVAALDGGELEPAKPDAEDIARHEGRAGAAPPADGTPEFPWTPDSDFLPSEEMEDATPLAVDIMRLVAKAQDAGRDPSTLSGHDLFDDDDPRGMAWDTARQKFDWRGAVWMTARGQRVWLKSRAREAAFRDNGTRES